MTFVLPKKVTDDYKKWRETASKEELEEWDKSGEEFLKDLVKKNKMVHIIKDGKDITEEYKNGH
jgi:hypothetical protein